MRSSEKIAIIGAGAIGASYASMFYDMSEDSVSFIAIGNRYEKLKKEGIVVNGKNYSIPVYQPDQTQTSYDLVIVSVKHHHLQPVINDFRNIMDDATTILSFMNGIESEETIGRVFGAEKVLYSIVLGIDAVRIGNSTNYDNQGRVFFGESTNKILTERVIKIKELFVQAQIHYVIPDDMIRTLWWKFMINVGINQASAALRAPYSRFQHAGEARLLMDSAMREVMIIAQRQGIDINEKDIESWHEVLSNLSPDGKTSMLQDIEDGRKTEVEMFSGKVIELGRRFGIPTPINKSLFQMIRKIEDRGLS